MPPDRPPDRPRIILEKSSTVRRRYQRSNKRLKFTAKQIKQMEREELLEKRAKDIREKEKRRVANKKKKIEQDAKAREEARRQGLPDPTAGKIPASQPLLSKFLGFKNKASPSEKPTESSPEPTPEPEPEAEPKPEPEPESDLEFDFGSESELEGLISEPGIPEPVIPAPVLPAPVMPAPVMPEPKPYSDNGHIESVSQDGDTEPDSDYFDDIDEDLQRELSILQNAGNWKDSNSHNSGQIIKNTIKTANDDDDDDEFSDCSAFYDDDIINKAEAAAVTQASHTDTNHTLLQPPPSAHPKNIASLVASFGDSFNDETADYLEDVFSRGCGDSFGELMEFGTKPQQAPL
ncbi:hypothetical protein N7520_008800 [Penicillium odoratum]|uniref:uncharacterized protein n=1 Tax=Penicillium odoratum TaxID=1167516 RepID=UPI002549B228|nr:uncharacterized protein N7520_008800 [Penicillium odoratum]KAJ5751883.1 hypothetical protein N7520_008800 [Penicillium odoratum]